MEPVIVSVTFNCTIEKLWQAITKVEQMWQWFFEMIPSFSATVGFTTEFLVRVEEKEFIHQWIILESIQNRRLKYNWKYKGYSGDSYVIFEIDEIDHQSVLTLSHVVTVPFPQNVEEFKRESCLAGWNYFIGQRLRQFIDSQK